MVGEPGDGLHEGLFLSELVLGLAQVSANGETVNDTAEQVNLPGLAGLDKNILGLVAELRGEDLVDFYVTKSLVYAKMFTNMPLFRVGLRKDLEGLVVRHTGSRDGVGALDGSELLMGYERRVGRVSNVQLALLQEANNILKESIYVSSIKQWKFYTVSQSSRKQEYLPWLQSSIRHHRSS